MLKPEKQNQIYLLYSHVDFFNAYIFIHQIISGISVSCPISPSTVEIVGGCPDSKEKWRLAAARKNCTAIASQCDEPDKLVYHCVINEYANKTLEVCAYWKIIVLGLFHEFLTLI